MNVSLPYRKEVWFHIAGRRAFINITDEVERCLKDSGIQEGLILVNAMHITTSVFINDDESGLHRDYDRWVEKLAPHEPVSQYLHNRTGEDNGDAHLKRQVMGREVVVAVTGGKLTSAPGSRSFTGSLTAGRKKGCWLRLSVNNNWRKSMGIEPTCRPLRRHTGIEVS